MKASSYALKLINKTFVSGVVENYKFGLKYSYHWSTLSSILLLACSNEPSERMEGSVQFLVHTQKSKRQTFGYH